MRFDPIQTRTALAQSVLSGELEIVDEVVIPAREARFAEIPEGFAHGELGDWMRKSLGSGGSLFLHQGVALAHLAAGDNLVLSTSTASGKSRVFMAAAMRAVLANKTARVLVFYPQKALGSDQFRRWQLELEHAGLPADLVGTVTGDTPMALREAVLTKARIVLATPDVMHLWLLPSLGARAVDRFLSNLAVLVLDEAHVLEAVFGTNAGLFLRRFRDAQRRLQAKRKSKPAPLQVVATTATLSDPQAHLRELVGVDFASVGEDLNGAPSHPLTLVHVEGPEIGGKAEAMCAELLQAFSRVLPAEAAQIAFADSRQGVERIACEIEDEGFLPYRGGLHPEDRQKVETALRDRRLRGVVATSALELGIDLPQFSLGMTMGVPPTRKALRQRIGRVGRATEGIFVVVARRSAFAARGSTFREFVTGPVEESHLYLGNKTLQFQHALCLAQESGGLDRTELSPEISWPEEFAKSLAAADPRAPHSFLQKRMLMVAEAKGPQRAVPLRSMPGERLPLRDVATDGILSDVDLRRALRETYPGATYIHFGARYRVEQWRFVGFGHEVMLKPIRSGARTYPMLSTRVSCSLDAEQVIDRNCLTGPSGCFAELNLQVTESVDGYRIGNTPFPYPRHGTSRDAKLTRRVRRFATTGVVLQIDEPWFAGEGEPQVLTRRAVAKALRQVLADVFGVAKGDIATAHRSVSFRTPVGEKRHANAIALFDDIEGGLRLTAPIFGRFEEALERLERAVMLAGEDAPLDVALVGKLREWFLGLEAGQAAVAAEVALEDGSLRVFAPGSVVGHRVNGDLVERKLLEPALVPSPAGEALMYRYEANPGVIGWAAHDHLETTGDEWRYASWDPLTGTLAELGEAL